MQLTGPRVSRLVNALVVHPKTLVVEPRLKAELLTKSVLVDALPSRIEASSASAPIESLSKHARPIIPEIRHYATQDDHPNREFVARSLYLNLTRSFHALFPSRFQNVQTATGSPVSFTWNRFDETIHVGGHMADYETFTRSKLAPFSESTDFTRERHHRDIASLCFDLSRQKISNDVTTGGMTTCNNLLYPHTGFIIDSFGWSADQLLFKSIMYLFSRLAAFGVSSGLTAMGKVLDVPLAGQAIYTNGRIFGFVCFQLNTLDLESESGSTNVAWVKSDVALYDRLKTSGKKSTVFGFKNDCVGLLYGMLLENQVTPKW